MGKENIRWHHDPFLFVFIICLYLWVMMGLFHLLHSSLDSGEDYKVNKKDERDRAILPHLSVFSLTLKSRRFNGWRGQRQIEWWLTHFPLVVTFAHLSSL